VFSTFPHENATADEYTLSDLIRGAWARFAKDPEAGPGWTTIGEGEVDVAVFQNGEEFMELVDQRTLDERCALWREVVVAKN
jgi:hypothetical protein